MAKVEAKGKPEDEAAGVQEEEEEEQAVEAEDLGEVSGGSIQFREKAPAEAPGSGGPAAGRTIWKGYDINEIPESFRPPADSKGKHSYTIRLDEAQICLGVLVRNKAIWVKKPEGCKGQYSFSQYDRLGDCFDECIKDCRKFLSDRPAARKLD